MKTTIRLTFADGAAPLEVPAEPGPYGLLIHASASSACNPITEAYSASDPETGAWVAAGPTPADAWDKAARRLESVANVLRCTPAHVLTLARDLTTRGTLAAIEHTTAAEATPAPSGG